MSDDLRHQVKVEVYRALSLALEGSGITTTAPRQRIAEAAGTMTARVNLGMPIPGEIIIIVGTPTGKRYFQVTTLETDKKGNAL